MRTGWLGVREHRSKKTQEEKPRRRVPQWTGLRRKTLWDWLQLLIVPAILVGVTFMWSASQTRIDNKREDRRIEFDHAAAEEARRDATLQSYLEDMSGLMLDKSLLTSKQNDAVRAVAHTVTLTALRRLDPQRKVAVVRFLHEAGLVVRPAPDIKAPVGLEEADLESTDFGKKALLYGADLAGADLLGANLVGANLQDANLQGTDLNGAHLEGAILKRANLRDASLVSAFLAGAQLRRAILGGAHLEGADLHGADLRNAHLTHASIGGADLRGANLRGALLMNTDLGGVDPDGPGPQAAWVLVQGLDLGRYTADLTPQRRHEFLDSQKAFLDSLSREELSVFKLTPEKLVRIRREANGG